MAPQAPRQLTSALRMERPQSLAQDIVIVDGASCSGKSLVSPLLSSLDRGELWLTDHLFEYLCATDAYGRMERDAAKALVRMYADFDLYNLQISRYTNLKASDITSAQNNLLGPRHDERLLAKDGDVVVRALRKRKPLLILMTHYIFHHSDLLFDAFGKRLKHYILTIRHPLWLVESWFEGRWDRRVGRDPREFQLCCNVGRKSVPWYAATWAEEYLQLNSMDQSIRAIHYFHQAFEKKRHGLSDADKRRFYILPYELFAADPEPFVKDLAKRLNAKKTAMTGRMLKKLSLPRKFDRARLEAQRAKMTLLFKRHRAGARYLKMMDQMSAEYENTYLK